MSWNWRLATASRVSVSIRLWRTSLYESPFICMWHLACCFWQIRWGGLPDLLLSTRGRSATHVQRDSSCFLQGKWFSCVFGVLQTMRMRIPVQIFNKFARWQISKYYSQGADIQYRTSNRNLKFQCQMSPTHLAHVFTIKASATKDEWFFIVQ